MEELIIEKAVPDDWEDAMELCWRTFLKYEAPVYGKEGTDSFLNFISDEKLYKMFLAGEYAMKVARLNGELVGVVTMRALNHISLLFVDERYHRQGIARELLKNLQNDCTRGDSVVMSVNASPYAIPFYKRLGFIETDVIKKADGITYLPMKLLNKIN